MSILKPSSRRDFLKNAALLSAALATSGAASLAGAADHTYKFVWSHYTGWEPFGYMQSSGIVERWAKKAGCKILIERLNSYTESINEFNNSLYDGCAMTTLDAMINPCHAGIDCTALICGDFSNGNDALISRNCSSIQELKGKKIALIKKTVSEYLMSRALESVGMTDRDIQIDSFESEEDIQNSYFLREKARIDHFVTWNPILMNIRQRDPNAKKLFDSSKIPAEILDAMVIRTSVPDNVRKAMLGAWYETLACMTDPTKRDAAFKYMAENASDTEPKLQKFISQLETTKMFGTVDEADAFVSSKDIQAVSDRVLRFLESRFYFDGKKKIGIQFPDGTVVGAADNIKLRFVRPV